MFTERHVVTCFLTSDRRILLLKRSNKVSTYQGRWAGVSGSVRDEPLAHAFREIHQETGLLPSHLHLVRRGSPIEIVDQVKRMRWQVHPFLFRVEEPAQITLSWEHTEFVWIDPRQLNQYNAVPMLEDALIRVWDLAELGPRSTLVRSQDLEPLVPDKPHRAESPSPEPAAPAASAEPQALHTAQPDKDEPGAHGRLRGGMSTGPWAQPTRGERVDLDAALPSDTGDTNDDSLQDDTATQPAGVKVKVLRTIEFPSPSLSATPTGEEMNRPLSTGPELLEDPVLAPLLAAIRDDRVSSASVLTRQAVDAIRVAGERSAALTHQDWLEDLRRVGRELSGLRPSMASIANCCAQVLYEMEFEVERADRQEPRHQLRAVLSRVIARQAEQERTWASNLADEISRLIPPGGSVMTMSYSSQVVEGLHRCKHFGLRVIVPEGRPRYEGRLLARAILAMGKSVTLITDAAIGLHVRETDLVIIGADALLADGSVVNRVGSYPLALAARAAKVPFYVAATLQKLDLRPDASQTLVLEEKESDEVWNEAGPGLDVRNVYYERVPPELITGIVTEDGLLEPSGLDWEVRARDYLLRALYGREPAA